MLDNISIHQLPATTTLLAVLPCNSSSEPIDLPFATHLIDLATRAAIEGALAHGVDLPVGAATSKGSTFLGANYAQDNLLQDIDAHAEYMAIQAAREQSPNVEPDTIAVTFEPCNACQDYFSTLPNLRHIIYLLPTIAVSSRSLVRPKDENILQRLKDTPRSYDITQIDNPDLRAIGELLLDVTTRNTITGVTTVDTVTLRDHLPERYLPTDIDA